MAATTATTYLHSSPVAKLTDIPSQTKQFLVDIANAEPTTPAHILDLGDVHRKLTTWKSALPRVRPFYAVKCNNDKVLLDALAALGTGFDCATEAEFTSMMARGVTNDRIVFAHPCKARHQLLAAKKLGVTRMTFDNADELQKIKDNYPEAEIILRIMADDSQSVCKFNSKFAAAKDDHPLLLERARELGLNVVGVSFHVGSGCSSAAPFADAVYRARMAFDLALMYGFKLRILDLGGGFPGDKMAPVQFDAIADVLRPALDKHFPAAEFPESDLDIIAEPGRYFVSSCCTLATRVIAKRSIPSAEEGEDKSVMYYINDGVYGAFNCVLYDHQIVHAQVLRAAKEGKVLATTVWGPSCDSMDCVKKDITLPELEEGDYIYWENMGAYTFCAQSNFNGFENSTPFYTYSTTADSELQLAALPKAFPVQADSTPTSLDAVEWSARPHY
eukprot:gene13678-13491_t